MPVLQAAHQTAFLQETIVLKLRMFVVPCLFSLVGFSPTVTADDLMAHWPLKTDAQDVSGNKRHAVPHHINYRDQVQGRAAAEFDGRQSWLEVPAAVAPNLATDDFTISLHAFTEDATDDVPGDLLSQYNLEKRQGFHLGIKTNAGVTFSQANSRQLQFGIDQNSHAESWTDCGRPGNALLAFALCSFKGQLYAGTCEPAAADQGRVYRWEQPDQWHDCGAPDASNSVVALAEFQGHLYAGTGKYRVAGSALPESQNNQPGGRIFRYAGDSKWIDCGQLPDTEAVGGLVVFKGQLYASSLYRPAGFFRYVGDQTWEPCATPERPADLPGDTATMRVEALGVYNGWLYATSYDGGRVFRFDGQQWFDCGALEQNTQTYSFAVRTGQLFVGTWPSGKVYRMEEPGQWTDVGRLGEELEVMGMLNHNGRLIAGTLPLAEVYQYDGKSNWNRLTRLDHTPDVKYRRAWTMAEHAGQVFCSTLPSGKVFSWRAGRIAMSDRTVPAGWTHIAAVRQAGTLKIYINGTLAGTETGFQAKDFQLAENQPLQIGFGPNDYFKGSLSDVRLYGSALSADQIQKLADP